MDIASSSKQTKNVDDCLTVGSQGSLLGKGLYGRRMLLNDLTASSFPFCFVQENTNTMVQKATTHMRKRRQQARGPQNSFQYMRFFNNGIILRNFFSCEKGEGGGVVVL